MLIIILYKYIVNVKIKSHRIDAIVTFCDVQKLNLD